MKNRQALAHSIKVKYRPVSGVSDNTPWGNYSSTQVTTMLMEAINVCDQEHEAEKNTEVSKLRAALVEIKAVAVSYLGYPSARIHYVVDQALKESPEPIRGETVTQVFIDEADKGVWARAADTISNLRTKLRKAQRGKAKALEELSVRLAQLRNMSKEFTACSVEKTEKHVRIKFLENELVSTQDTVIEARLKWNLAEKEIVRLRTWGARFTKDLETALEQRNLVISKKDVCERQITELRGKLESAEQHVQFLKKIRDATRKDQERTEAALKLARHVIETHRHADLTNHNVIKNLRLELEKAQNKTAPVLTPPPRNPDTAPESAPHGYVECRNKCGTWTKRGPLCHLCHIARSKRENGVTVVDAAELERLWGKDCTPPAPKLAEEKPPASYTECEKKCGRWTRKYANGEHWCNHCSTDSEVGLKILDKEYGPDWTPTLIRSFDFPDSDAWEDLPDGAAHPHPLFRDSYVRDRASFTGWRLK